MNQGSYLKVKTESFDKEHRHFGGLIYQSDFNTDYRGCDNFSGSPIASRIEADFRREKKLFGISEKGNCDTYGKSGKYD